MDELVAGDQVIGFINSVKLSYLKYIILVPSVHVIGLPVLVEEQRVSS